MRNLFRQWPERTEEIGGWTVKFALDREVFHDISTITGVGPRVVKRRLEEAPHGKQLVHNAFAEEWPFEPDGAGDGPESADSPRRTPRRRAATTSVDPVAPLQPALAEAVASAEGVPKPSMFRRYDLRRARGTHSRREPASHQAEALAALQDWYRARPTPHRGGILALPTGGGKTFTTVRFLCQEPLSDGYKVLWLAHTHHLLEQALDAFGPVDGGPTTSLEVAHIAEPRGQLDVRVISATVGHFPVSSVSSADDVVIATLQTIVAAYNRGHEKLSAFLDSSEGKLVVVFDEAHHAPAPSYCRLLERLREAYPDAYFLGLTATPTYSDERRQGWLKKLFPQDLLFTVSRSRLIAAGVLSKPHFENRRTELTFELGEAEYERWLTSYGDLPEDVISRLAENQGRNDFIADTYVEGKEKYGKTLIFADRWYQCDYLREALRKRGVRADVVYSHVDARLGTAEERKLLVDLFRIARHMGQSNGVAPVFFPFEERAAHDIDAIARECVDRDLGVRALEEALRAEYTRVDRFWRSLYSNYGLFYVQYQAAQRRLLDAEHHGIEPERYSGVVDTPHRPPIREPSEAVKAAVFRRDGHRCCCCGASDGLEVDHIVPLYLGGASDIDQLQTLCWVCNSNKAINELNFRTTRTPLTGPSRFVNLPFPSDADLSGDNAWLRYLQRSVNSSTGAPRWTPSCAVTTAAGVSASPAWDRSHVDRAASR